MAQWTVRKLLWELFSQTHWLILDAVKSINGILGTLFLLFCMLIAQFTQKGYEEVKWTQIISPVWFTVIIAFLVLSGWLSKIVQMLNSSDKIASEANKQLAVVNERRAELSDVTERLYKLMMEHSRHLDEDKPYAEIADKLKKFASVALLAPHQHELDTALNTVHPNPKRKIGEVHKVIGRWSNEINADWIRATLKANELAEF